MGSTLLVVRFIYAGFIVTWLQFIFLLNFMHPPEKPIPRVYPVVFGVLSTASIFVCVKLRKQFLHEPAASLRTQPENQSLLNRWKAGNILSFAFAESTILLGFLLRSLGEKWEIAGAFFAAGLLLQLVWAPRRIQVLPRGVR
jgi:hypothetical protein